MSAPPARKRVIKKVAGHGHHGGAWKIAYADFVTAMMALFMVLWLLASTDENARKEISKYFRTGILPDAEMAMNGGAQYVPSVIERAPVPPPPERADATAAKQKLEEAIAHMAANHAELAAIASRVRVVATDDGLLLEIVDEDGGEGMLFDTASARLKPAMVEFLEVLGPMLAARTETIELHGHTDATPFLPGTGRTNWELSSERAAAARKIIEAGGVAPERIVGVLGRGAATPLDPEHPNAAVNRRLSVLLRYKPPIAAAASASPTPVIPPPITPPPP